MKRYGISIALLLACRFSKVYITNANVHKVLYIILDLLDKCMNKYFLNQMYITASSHKMANGKQASGAYSASSLIWKLKVCTSFWIYFVRTIYFKGRLQTLSLLYLNYWCEGGKTCCSIYNIYDVYNEQYESSLLADHFQDMIWVAYFYRL